MTYLLQLTNSQRSFYCSVPAQSSS